MTREQMVDIAVRFAIAECGTPIHAKNGAFLVAETFIDRTRAHFNRLWWWQNTFRPPNWALH